MRGRGGGLSVDVLREVVYNIGIGMHMAK